MATNKPVAIRRKKEKFQMFYLCCLCFMILFSVGISTFEIPSISYLNLKAEKFYEFEPKSDQITLEFEFDNFAQCVSDLGLASLNFRCLKF